MEDDDDLIHDEEENVGSDEGEGEDLIEGMEE